MGVDGWTRVERSAVTVWAVPGPPPLAALAAELPQRANGSCAKADAYCAYPASYSCASSSFSRCISSCAWTAHSDASDIWQNLIDQLWRSLKDRADLTLDVKARPEELRALRHSHRWDVERSLSALLWRTTYHGCLFSEPECSTGCYRPPLMTSLLKMLQL